MLVLSHSFFNFQSPPPLSNVHRDTMKKIWWGDFGSLEHVIKYLSSLSLQVGGKNRLWMLSCHMIFKITVYNFQFTACSFVVLAVPCHIAHVHTHTHTS